MVFKNKWRRGYRYGFCALLVLLMIYSAAEPAYPWMHLSWMETNVEEGGTPQVLTMKWFVSDLDDNGDGIVDKSVISEVEYSFDPDSGTLEDIPSGIFQEGVDVLIEGGDYGFNPAEVQEVIRSLNRWERILSANDQPLHYFAYEIIGVASASLEGESAEEGSSGAPRVPA